MDMAGPFCSVFFDVIGQGSFLLIRAEAEGWGDDSPSFERDPAAPLEVAQDQQASSSSSSWGGTIQSEAPERGGSGWTTPNPSGRKWTRDDISPAPLAGTKPEESRPSEAFVPDDDMWSCEAHDIFSGTPI